MTNSPKGVTKRNTIGTSTRSDVLGIGYVKNTLDLGLRSMTVAEKLFPPDRSGLRYKANPYLTAATAAIAAQAGTYSVSTATTTDEACTVTDQVTYAVHDFEFEETQSRINLGQSYYLDMAAAIAVKVDQFVLNKVLDSAGSSYSAPAGGFTTAGNINTIFANINSKLDGYSDTWRGKFVVLENTDMVGLYVAGATNGFNFADAVLRNGEVGEWMGVKIYVVRSGVFTNATIGTLTATNLNHRLAGVREVSAYFMQPGGMHYDEKKVTTKTGMEISCWCNIGAQVWTQKANLLIDIDVSA